MVVGLVSTFTIEEQSREDNTNSSQDFLFGDTNLQFYYF